ncbi:Fe-S cluster assembly ATPase SufC [Candidatus Roizmanbacteria bacterium]|nr:Fe-S cluster assembly ATPase SufC [Candidatus Roizmanbacteria bacterium]
MLTIKNLSVSAQNKKILEDITYTFKKNKIYAVMGPNASGKSSLAFSIMGHPVYKISSKSEIIFKRRKINGLEPYKRAERGLFLSFQSPLPLSGVTVLQLLQVALSKKLDVLAMRKKAKQVAKELHMPEDLLSRSLNDGTSGGEKKKLEILQAVLLDRDLMIFDEIDTGVDVDALKTIATFLKKNRKGKTYILITHYNRILRYLKPDEVLVLGDGKLVKTGKHTLADKIEKAGYEMLNSKRKTIFRQAQDPERS